MTQSPYVPSSGGQDQDPQSGEWSTTGSSGYASDQPDFDPAAPYGQFDEPGVAGSTATEDVYIPASGGTGSTGGSAAKDTAKTEAADLKNTAVDKGQQVAGVAKEQAAAVKDTALDKGQQVAEVAKSEVSKVTAEATGQFKDLVQQGRTELSSQAGAQQQRLGALIRSFADELGTMASSTSNSGPLTDLAQQGSRKVGEVAYWVENTEPSEILESARNFARRRTVPFLVGSALAGVVVGRLSRSIAAQAKDEKVANQAPALGTSTYGTATPATGYGTSTYTTGGYETGTYDTGYADTTPTTYDDTVTYVEPNRGDLTR